MVYKIDTNEITSFIERQRYMYNQED